MITIEFRKDEMENIRLALAVAYNELDWDVFRILEDRIQGIIDEAIWREES